MNALEEISLKLDFLRQVLQEAEAAAIRLRGTDWFAWVTAGGSNTVLLAAETGVAEVLITATEVWVLTDEIEAQRLKDEQLPEGSAYQVFVHPWAQAAEREAFVQGMTGGGTVLSDRPSPSEAPLPAALVHFRRCLLPSEIDRYRQVGHRAGEAMTQVLQQAQPDWTEDQLAGAGAAALWQRGLHPALTLVAGDRRLPRYRHPLPGGDPLGRCAMLVFCARGAGLIVSLTRFVYFGGLSPQERQLHQEIAEIEAIALHHSQIDTPLNAVYQALAEAYAQRGYPRAISEHHQGGTAGYGAREIVATPHTSDRLAAGMAIAWNPSLPGAKIEDTFVLTTENHLENLSLDRQFPCTEIAGRLRPLPLER